MKRFDITFVYRWRTTSTGVGSTELFRQSASSSGEGYPEHRYTPLQCLAALTAGSTGKMIG
jgi:hypothetical protein